MSEVVSFPFYMLRLTYEWNCPTVLSHTLKRVQATVKSVLVPAVMIKNDF